MIYAGIFVIRKILTAITLCNQQVASLMCLLSLHYVDIPDHQSWYVSVDLHWLRHSLRLLLTQDQHMMQWIHSTHSDDCVSISSCPSMLWCKLDQFSRFRVSSTVTQDQWERDDSSLGFFSRSPEITITIYTPCLSWRKTWIKWTLFILDSTSIWVYHI